MHKQKQTDISVEKEISSFLDENLYSDRRFVKNYKRYNDVENQILGKDVKATFKKGLNQSYNLVNCLIDEKCQTHYINANLPQNGFELSFLDQNNQMQKGWLLDESLKTTHYLIIWPFSRNEDREWSKEDLAYFDKSNIGKLDCLLLKKSDILDFLANWGFNKEDLIQKNKYIRNSAENKNPIYTNYSFIRFYYSYYFPEKPITVSIRKEQLKRISIARFLVKKDKLQVLD